MIDYILYAIFILLFINYVIFLITVLSGLSKLKTFSNKKILDEFISIIIPFRNEAENILNNLKSIKKLNYPVDKFEVIYVNDSSSDNSFDLLTNNITAENIKVISVPETFSPNAHKKRAVRYGIENANGEIIVTTDADCVFNNDWLGALLSNLDEDTGFVSGPVEFYDEGNLFSKLQKLEFAGLIFTGAGLIGAGKPTICNAANTAYRKKVFEQVNGFADQMDLSSGDDELLMQKIAKDTDYKVKFSLNKNSIVKTKANNSLNSFYQQRKRWASKGLFYRSKILIAALILIYLFYLGLIIQPILIFSVSIDYIFIFVISLSLKFFLEYLIMKRGKILLFDTLSLKPFLIAEMLQIPYIIIAGIAGAFGNYKWKGRKVKR